MPVSPNRPESFVQRTLADAIAHGPLPLPVALRIANDLALELRDLHQESRAYGKLTAGSVALTDFGARLMPQRAYWDQAVPERDVQAFGKVVYQMLHGNSPPSTLTATGINIPAWQTAEEKLKATSSKLALRCLNPKGSRMTMQQVATELRVLGVVQRQDDAAGRPSPEEAPPPAYKAPATWTPPIGMLIDTPGAIPLPLPAPLEQAGFTAQAQSPTGHREMSQPVVPLGPTSFGAPRPKVPAVEAKRGGKCPKCDAGVVYESRARSNFEQFVERLKLPIVRCHRCYHRYIVFGRVRIPKDMPVGTARRFRPKKRA